MKKKIVLKIQGMHCTSCAMNIDGELEDTEGVMESKTNFAKAETEVTFDESKLDEEKIVAVVKTVGYSATPVE